MQYKRSEHGSEKKKEILKQIRETMKHRNHIDGSIDFIGEFLYGPGKGSSVLNSVRALGLPLVDDWECLKSMVITTYPLLQLLLLHLVWNLFTMVKTWVPRCEYLKHIAGH